MGKGGWTHPNHEGLAQYSLEEIAGHTERTDRWIVVDGYVYDVTNWAKRHPGGEKIISGYAGQDASDAWYAFHPNKPYVSKFMKNLVVGRVREEKSLSILEQTSKEASLVEDFRKLRTAAENAGYFRSSAFFFTLTMLQILLLDALGWWILVTFGAGWVQFLVAACILATAQIQAGWSQHDYGHLSVFDNTRVNHYVQIFLLNFIKGASSDWWNFRHYNHHAKPNVITKDPDISLAPLFVVGKTVATEYGKKKRKYLPYLSQHKYFHFVLPPFLLPIYFNFEITYFLIKRRRWQEMFWMVTFFVRWYLIYGPTLGAWGVVGLFFLVRVFESHWFVWATQMSHIPMYVDYDQKHDWVTTQVMASCNIEQSWFNDWWSGHLNFQIEHHLFPTMPRHNLYKVAPMVKSLCEKYNIVYLNKTLWTALCDVVKALEVSGQMWYDAYNN